MSVLTGISNAEATNQQQRAYQFPGTHEVVVKTIQIGEGKEGTPFVSVTCEIADTTADNLATGEELVLLATRSKGSGLKWQTPKKLNEMFLVEAQTLLSAVFGEDIEITDDIEAAVVEDPNIAEGNTLRVKVTPTPYGTEGRLFNKTTYLAA